MCIYFSRQLINIKRSRLNFHMYKIIIDWWVLIYCLSLIQFTTYTLWDRHICQYMKLFQFLIGFMYIFHTYMNICVILCIWCFSCVTNIICVSWLLDMQETEDLIWYLLSWSRDLPLQNEFVGFLLQSAELCYFVYITYVTYVQNIMQPNLKTTVPPSNLLQLHFLFILHHLLHHLVH